MKYPDDVPLLTDEVVTLRPHQPDDLDAIFEQCQDPDSQRYTTIPVPYTRDDAAAFLKSRAECWESGTSWPFAMQVEGGVGPTRFAGSIGLGLKAPGIAEVGYGTHPAVRGRGVTTAALRLLLDWAFETQGLKTVIWRSIAGNLASWRVAWRNGFSFEQTTRGTLPRRGEALDGWTAVLLASDGREPKNRWLQVPRLTDGRTLLREMRPDDEQRYLETVLDPESDLWLREIPFPRTPAAYGDHLRDAGLWTALGRAVFWAIADAETDSYVGGFGMFGFGGLEHNSAEVGYRCHPDSRGKGYVSGALRLALAKAFTAEADGGYGLDRVSLDAAEGNLASQAVARACGFTQSGRDRRCYWLPDGRVVDQLRFDLLADEWRAASAEEMVGS
jgi:RimJ/RimL family protein N-acetyltransferase